jgi:phosphoserine phosphatase
MTLSLAAEYFLDRYSFDGAFGCELDEDPHGRLGGTVRKYVEPKDKVSFMREYCQANAIDPSQCVAVGDARADVPLFEAVGLAIAINATEPAKAAADVAIDTDDLRAVIPLVSDRLST